MRPWWLALALAVLGVGVLAPRIASADSQVAILSLEISGDGPPELRGQLLKRLEEGIADAGSEVTGLEALLVALAPTPELIGCSSSTCLDRIREITTARRFVRATVEARGTAYTIHLELLEPAHDDNVIRQIDETCSVCTIPELNDLTRKATRQLFEAEPAQPKVLLTSQPLGAFFEIDGKAAGLSPLPVELSPGEHTVVARLQGHAVARETIMVSGSGQEPESFTVRLLALSSAEPARPYALWKWVTVGGAVAASATGIVLMAIDGGTCDQDGARQCEEIRETFAGGVAVLSGGLLLGAVSGWMFWSDGKSRDRMESSSISLRRTDGGMLGSVRLAF